MKCLIEYLRFRWGDGLTDKQHKAVKILKIIAAIVSALIAGFGAGKFS